MEARLSPVPEGLLKFRFAAVVRTGGADAGNEAALDFHLSPVARMLALASPGIGDRCYGTRTAAGECCP